MPRVLILLAALATAAPARADWQYTRWGMSPAAVVAASGGAARLQPGDRDDRVFNLDLKAVGTYETPSLSYEADFLFTRRSNRLAAVKLMPAEGQCDALREELAETYGKPLADRRDFTMMSVETQTWRDAQGNNHVLFADVQTGAGRRLCHVLYRPLGRRR
jgi:hypothetical protein